MQANGLVPIVEPEILMEGNHSIEACACATERVLSELFTQLRKNMVMLEGTVLKPNMVVPGINWSGTVEPDDTARMTVKCMQVTTWPCDETVWH